MTSWSPETLELRPFGRWLRAVLDGRSRRPKTAGLKGVEMLKRFGISLGLVGALAAIAVSVASASVVVPAVPVSAYGDSLLSGLATTISGVLPYAAGITVFAIGVGMLKRWLGHRKATHV